MRWISKVAFGGCAAVAAVIVAAGPAMAEPTTTPAATDYVAVGSDTIQALYDQFQADFTSTPHIESFDATGTATITPKTGCSAITRPNGSGAGIAAIGANTTTSDGAHYCVDVARASRTPSTGDPTGLSWLALAGDGVSWAAVDGGNAPANLSATDLYDIYTCQVTTWAGLPDAPAGASTATIDPVLPQSASGTRSFFLSALNASQGLSGSVSPGSCVDTTTQPEENEGTNPVFNTSTNANAVNVVYPYSAAVYAGQVFNGHATTDSAPGQLTLRQIEGTDALTTSDSFHVVSPDFDPDFQRLVYNVVRTASLGTTTGKDGDVGSIVGQSGFDCTNATAVSDVESYGFAGLGDNCGVTFFTT